MWQYRYSDELYHFSLFKRKSTATKTKSNGDWKSHKYYTKIELPNKKVRYFYSRLEYLAYQAGQKVKQTVQSVSNAVASESKILNDKSSTIRSNSNIEAIKKYLNQSKILVDKNREKTTSQIKATLTTPTKKLISSTISKLTSSTVFKASITIIDAVATAISNKKFLNNHDTKPTKIETSDNDSNEDLMHKINPNYNPDWQKTWNSIDDGYANNCANCTLTYDMAKRGIDVQTAPWSLDGMTQPEILDCYHGEKLQTQRYTDNTSLEAMKKTNEQIWEQVAKEQGDGARGYLMMYWKDGGGHAVNYVIEDGHAYIIDSQVNKKLEMNEYLLYANEYSFFRTDNIMVDTNKVSKYINMGGKKK